MEDEHGQQHYSGRLWTFYQAQLVQRGPKCAKSEKSKNTQLTPSYLLEVSFVLWDFLLCFALRATKDSSSMPAMHVHSFIFYPLSCLGSQVVGVYLGCLKESGWIDSNRSPVNWQIMYQLFMTWFEIASSVITMTKSWLRCRKYNTIRKVSLNLQNYKPAGL